MELTIGGSVVLIDDEDYDKIKPYRWHIHQSRVHKYVRYTDYKSIHFMLHRFILGLPDSKIQVDHINGDTLDNRKENLRLCSQSQNQINRAVQKNNTTGFKGVKRSPNKKRFVAKIKYNNKDYYIGTFDTAEEAGKAYDKKALELFGEFAFINFK